MNKMKKRAIYKYAAILLQHILTQPEEDIPKCGCGTMDKMNGGKGVRIDNAPIPKERLDQSLEMLRSMTVRCEVDLQIEGEKHTLQSEGKLALSHVLIQVKDKKTNEYVKDREYVNLYKFDDQSELVALSLLKSGTIM